MIDKSFYWFLAVVIGTVSGAVYGLTRGHSSQEAFEGQVIRALPPACQREIERAIKDLNARVDDTE